MAIAVTGTESLDCSFVVPEAHDTPVDGVLSRWSETYTSLPAIAVTPKTEEDIIRAIGIAKQNSLKVIPTGGGHGTFLEIGAQSLVLDLELFKSIQLDQENGSVRIGGGVTTGDLIKALAAEGYYTAVPNSNAVGVVGAILGGGNTAVNGLHGFMVDNVVSLRIVTADGKAVDVHPSSSGDHLALFNVLRGAGHGFGVITSAVIKIYPIRPLSLPDDKLWMRTLIFPPPALSDAAQAFLDFSVTEPLNVQLTFLRAPPGFPSAGAPLIILSASFFGPSAEAEKATSVLFDENLVSKTIKADTTLVPLANMNDGLDAHNAHGGFKNINGARVKALSTEAVSKAFAAWVNGTDDIQDAKRTVVVLHAFNPNKLQANGVGQDGKGVFLESRDRGFNMTILAWCASSGSQGRLREMVDQILAAGRGSDNVAPRTMPNTMRLQESLDNLFTPERLAELGRVKKVWDPENVFLSPYERETKL
jgi:hypothetical protein